MLDADLWSDIAPNLKPFGPIIHADPAGVVSIEDMATKILSQAPETSVLVGFSMGGYVARKSSAERRSGCRNWFCSRLRRGETEVFRCSEQL